MRLAALLAALLLAACATPGEYKIPLALENGTFDELVIEPDGSGDRALFCVQAGLSVICYFGTAEGRTYHFLYPLMQTDEFLEPEAGS